MVRDVWKLRSADRKNLSLIPHTLDYFQDHFVGRRMSDGWSAPPAAVDGKTKRLRDFVSWMSQVPVVSPLAKQYLEPLIGPHVEFLPFIELRGKTYHAVNVLETMSDCLDRPASEITYSVDDSTLIVNVTTYRFHHDRIRAVPIFKIPDDHFGSVFVTQPFVDVVIANRITGAKFVDPAANPFDAIMSGQSGNTVPGIWEG